MDVEERMQAIKGRQKTACALAENGIYGMNGRRAGLKKVWDTLLSKSKKVGRKQEVDPMVDREIVCPTRYLCGTFSISVTTLIRSERTTSTVSASGSFFQG